MCVCTLVCAHMWLNGGKLFAVESLYPTGTIGWSSAQTCSGLQTPPRESEDKYIVLA